MNAKKVKEKSKVLFKCLQRSGLVTYYLVKSYDGKAISVASEIQESFKMSLCTSPGNFLTGCSPSNVRDILLDKSCFS